MDFALQYLRHGKALCGKVFGNFVETFNRLVDFYANLKGDAEISEDGLVTVDRADPAHLVIRLDRARLGSSAASAAASGESAFQAVPVYATDGTTLDHWEIRNCYFMKAGVMAGSDNFTVLPAEAAGKFICLKVVLTSSPTVSVTCVTSPAGMQYDASYYLVPLYKADSAGTALVDLRTMPQVQVFEVGLS